MPKTIEDVLARNGIAPDNTLKHYGVPGMRWGKRRTRKQLEAAAKKREALAEMSDDELRTKINRLKLEQEYTKLTTPQIQTGKNAVGQILKEVGKQQAKNFLNKQTEKMLDDLMTVAGEKSAARKLSRNQLAIAR